MIYSIISYATLFAVIVLIGQSFQRSTYPISLLLVLTGILLSFVPFFPKVALNPSLVLNVFLPLLIYQISSFSSWREVRKNIRSITLLSIGHVIFITILVAVIIHAIAPELSWPLAFVLGAVISPPDDVAIVSIAEKIRMPERTVTILEGEAIFNDATALVLFRFALAALISHEFSLLYATTYFVVDIVGEVIYGISVGFALGYLRLKIADPMLHIIASLLTPFIAYIPVEMLGGSGIIATAISGFIIGNYFAIRFSPEFRLYSRVLWPTLAFTLQGLLFLMVGLNLESILSNIAMIPWSKLALYTSATLGAVIFGRFFWVYVFVVYIPRLFPKIRKRDPLPPWQYPFIVSWAGMRGAISLAAALALPVLPMIGGASPRELVIFLTMSVIIATLLIQGLTLPSLLKWIGVTKYGQREEYKEHLSELTVRLKMAKAVLRWLFRYKKEIKDDPKLLEQVKAYIKDYRLLRAHLTDTIEDHDGTQHDHEAEMRAETLLISQIIEIEKTALLQLWHDDKLSLKLRNKLLERLDHRLKHLSS